eukprot:CAMPEP_0167754650 /NCGR_PEP_ID=MMETSP0110_2-20121227/8388_1 /TAXON_ID=629695 /ORGANISM="Gymnochlora sp., Strain CCMP2014" /LENGTH=233 /DNA_ID=CAMNT_0007640553 /DNA_START=122 /DNA_END=823 /DNA_ORIENTATION=-
MQSSRRVSCAGRIASMIEIEGEWDFWKLDECTRSIEQGGIVVLPSDSCYIFVASIMKKDAVSKIYTLKNIPPTTQKPLSLVCHSISQISEYTDGLRSKSAFKLIKSCLPGPYTFILPVSNKVPKTVIENKTHKKTWKRREIGIRMPNEPILMEAIQGLEFPVLCSSVPKARDLSELCEEGLEIFDSWKYDVDFIVDAGERSDTPSTVVDMTDESGAINIIREGAGDISVFETA